jgi:hypothetical protein
MDFETYKNHAPYPDKPARPKMFQKASLFDKYVPPAEVRAYADKLEAYEAEMLVYRKKQADWNKIQGDLNDRFKNDAIREAGLEGHPKAEKCWEKAWETGHSSGNSEILFRLKEFAEVAL